MYYFHFQELPKNAYEIVSGRIFVSMTRVHDGSNCIVSEFKSNEELIEVMPFSFHKYSP